VEEAVGVMKHWIYKRLALEVTILKKETTQIKQGWFFRVLKIVIKLPGNDLMRRSTVI